MNCLNRDSRLSNHDINKHSSRDRPEYYSIKNVLEETRNDIEADFNLKLPIYKKAGMQSANQRMARNNSNFNMPSKSNESRSSRN